MGGHRHASAALPRKRPGTHYIGCWVGPRAGLDRCGTSRLPPGFHPRTGPPVVQQNQNGCFILRRQLKITLQCRWQVNKERLWNGNGRGTTEVLSQCHLPAGNPTRTGLGKRPVVRHDRSAANCLLRETAPNQDRGWWVNFRRVLDYSYSWRFQLFSNFRTYLMELNVA